MARNPLNKMKFVKIADHSASSTDAVTSSIVDTAGYQGVVFCTSLSTANATNSIKVQQNTANQTTGMADLTGTSVVSGTSDEDLIVAVHQPLERYLQVVVTRSVATTCESIWAVLYDGPATVSSTAVSGTAAAEQHVSPAEGTA